MDLKPGASFRSFYICRKGSPFPTLEQEMGANQDLSPQMPSLRLSPVASWEAAPFEPCSDRFTASDVQPAANIPRCHGSAAGTARWAPQQPEEQHGWPDAECDGSAAGTTPRPSQQPEEWYGEPDARPDGPVHSTAFVPGRHQLLSCEAAGEGASGREGGLQEAPCACA